MGKILDYLTQEWVDKQLAVAKAPVVPLTADEEEAFLQMLVRLAKHLAMPDTDLAELEAQVRREGAKDMQTRAERDNDPETRVSRLLNRCIGVCEYEYASGSAPKVVREHCRLAAQEALGYLPSLDYSVKQQRIAKGLVPSSARSIAERYGGTWWMAGRQNAGVEYSYVNQPLGEGGNVRLWYVAAVAGDPELARSVATAYQALPPVQISPSAVRDAILRCALAGDTEGEELLADQLEPGYAADFPPEMIELPLGVIRREPALILEGVRKLGTRFKGKWDLKKYRAWYDKRQPKLAGQPHPNGTWEQFLESCKHDLFGLHWVFSWWAIAWLQVARHRGLDEVFEPKNRKVFSEWVPLAMIKED